MLTVSELKDRVGFILGIEEHGPDADWFAIARHSAELIPLIPDGTPPIVKAYLGDCDIRRVSPNFALCQRRELIQFLRS